MTYQERLCCFGLESLQVRRMKYDLLMCYKVIHSLVTIHTNGFFVFFLILFSLRDTATNCSNVFSGVNASKYFYTVSQKNSSLLFVITWSNANRF